MKPERILLPIDVNRCPVDVFDVVNGFAKGPEVTVILLHVISLNIASPENRVYQEIANESRHWLQRLADTYVHPLAFPVARVRTGKPSEQILHEAHTENVDLIILPTFGASRWNRLMHFWKPPAPLVSPLGEKLIRDATCAVFVVLARKTLDCARVWGRLVENSDDVPVAIFPSQPKLLGAASCRRLQPGSSLMTRYTRS